MTDQTPGVRRFCSQCGETLSGGERFCSSCGASTDGSPPAPPAPPPQHGQQQRTNGLAIASLVLGILWLYWVGSVLALIFGYRARRQIDESNGREGGRGLAIAGIVLGWIGVAVVGVAVLAIMAIGLLGEEADTEFQPTDGTIGAPPFVDHGPNDQMGRPQDVIL